MQAAACKTSVPFSSLFFKNFFSKQRQQPRGWAPCFVPEWSAAAEELKICLDCVQTEMIFALLLGETPNGLQFEPTRLKTSPSSSHQSGQCTPYGHSALLPLCIPYLMPPALRLEANTPDIGSSRLRMPPQPGMWRRVARDAPIRSRR